MNGLDFWRLAEELSVVDATILITGNNPEEFEWVYDESGSSIYDACNQREKIQKTDYEGFDAVFYAIKNAIINNKLKANIFLPARSVIYKSFKVDGEWNSNTDPEAFQNEENITFDKAVFIREISFINRTKPRLCDLKEITILEEPDWKRTTVTVDNLKAWLASRGFYPEFFFPQGHVEGFRNPNHPRYSPKLACAVAAWESVKSASKNRSVKQTLEKWIEVNATRFGVSNADGIPPKKAVEDIAAVTNWQPSGGATPTSPQVSVEIDEAEPEDVQNFDLPTDDTDEIPF